MQFGLKFKYWAGKVSRYLLLLLFLGYYSSITQFSHCHIVNGITIVHSHPYKSGNGSGSNGPEHTDKELKIIQLLSDFSTTAVAITFVALAYRFLLREIHVSWTADGYRLASGHCTYSLRAPPFEMPFLVLR